ncbi:MAG: hypothetical protein IKQ41_09615 [Clostridia bacterium]|nr:hypothetical protein [Clostridia bacterium]
MRKTACFFFLFLAFALAAPGQASQMSREDTLWLFKSIGDMPLIAASGAGAWEGRLKVSANGSFTGTYYDADADMVYEVSFAGSFSRNAQVHGHSYWLWVEELTTQQTPGTVSADEYGDPVTYIDAPFARHTYMVLTLPGTPGEEIPEMVRGEIGGTYGEWEDYSRFFTLTRLEDGWGFFADPSLLPADGEADGGEDPQSRDGGLAVTPVPAGTPASFDPSAWVGYWMTRDDSLAELVIFGGADGSPLRAQAFFLRTMEMNAALTPQADGSLRFESDDGAYIGRLAKLESGGLSLIFTGGYAYEDEEATEYQAYFSRGFVYDIALYDELWFDERGNAGASDSDWVGTWSVEKNGRESTLRIGMQNGGLYLRVALGNGYSFEGPLDKNGETDMDFFGGDFFCMLTLSRKQGKIAMSEVGSEIDGVYEWLEDFYYGVAEFQFVSSDETPYTAEMDLPEPVALLPIPGKTGYLQVPVAWVDATSYLIGKNDETAYAPFRMIDGDETTAFQFSTQTTPLGQAYLYFDFDGPVTLDELWMKNGFWKITAGLDQYTRNSRVKQMTIFVRYYGDDDYQELKTVTLKDDSARRDWKTIHLNGVENVTGVRIRIDQIYTGSKFKTDVCISEIMFVQAAGQ